MTREQAEGRYAAALAAASAECERTGVVSPAAFGDVVGGVVGMMVTSEGASLGVCLDEILKGIRRLRAELDGPAS